MALLAADGTETRELRACLPVPDAQPTTLVVAWPARSRSLQVAAFVRAATAVAARHQPR
jgi:hypothetical protein